MVSTVMCVWNSCKLVPEGVKVEAQSRKNHVKVHTVCSDPMASVAFVSSNVHPAESGSPVPECGSGSTSYAEELMPV